MWDYLKKLFPATNPIFNKSIGANLNPHDDRDIKLVDVWAATGNALRQPKDKYITDISILPVQDQSDKPECVGEGEGLAVQYYIYKVTGIVLNISRRFIFAMCKMFDGNPSPSGTIPRIGALVVTKYYGAATTLTVPDDTSLPYADFINVKLTGAVLDDAAKNKLPGFAIISQDVNVICQAIEDHGLITATLPVDFTKWYTAFIAKLFKIDGYHRVDFYGHELVEGRRKIYFRNHWSIGWGDNGNGWFWLDEYLSMVYDIQVYTEIPAGMLEKARATNFQFDPAQPIKFGDSGYLVYKLQQRLQSAGYLKNVDIASIEPYFGNMTAAALMSYQLDNHIDSAANIQALAGKSCGPKTIAFMNNQTGPTPKKNLINALAQAIQSFEGWTVGSRSYVNKNPGNIRSWPTQIGTAGGFAVFATYNDGFKALTDLLTNAASGKSSSYRSTMTIYDFFNTYAPSSDNNNPNRYAEFVATKMGVSPSIQIGNLL